jgi:hypothetical protein
MSDANILSQTKYQNMIRAIAHGPVMGENLLFFSSALRLANVASFTLQ